MLTNLRNAKKFPTWFKTDLGIKPHRFFTGITPEQRTLILLDDRKGGFKQGRGKSLCLMFRQSRHASQSKLIRVRKFFIPFEIEGSHTYQFLIDESAQMKSQFIRITVEHAVFHSTAWPQHFLADRVSILGLNS